MVDEFLCLAFGDHTVFQIAFNVDIQERRHTTEAHCGAVLRFHGSEVGEVSPLDGFLRVFGRAGNIVAVGSGHFLHLFQRNVLLIDFFAQADNAFQVLARFQIGL